MRKTPLHFINAPNLICGNGHVHLSRCVGRRVTTEYGDGEKGCTRQTGNHIAIFSLCDGATVTLWLIFAY